MGKVDYAKVVEEREKGCSVQELADNYEVSTRTIYRWLAKGA